MEKRLDQMLKSLVKVRLLPLLLSLLQVDATSLYVVTVNLWYTLILSSRIQLLEMVQI